MTDEIKKLASRLLAAVVASVIYCLLNYAGFQFPVLRSERPGTNLVSGLVPPTGSNDGWADPYGIDK
jgi:hypothetical protein